MTNNGGQSARFSRSFSQNNFNGLVIKNRFATQTDIINHLTWSPSTNPSVAGYRILRNGEAIATIPQNGPFVFNDHNRRKTRFIFIH
ncbi:MAG: hypothetical protein HWD61_04125 [Parachlamydiaceae bacterium]|nr:MAG: hypothetical protein HWD61_04125 [Parachlamydiaceae bacterium]